MRATKSKSPPFPTAGKGRAPAIFDLSLFERDQPGWRKREGGFGRIFWCHVRSAVNGLFGQAVGIGVVLAADVGDGELLKARDQRLAGVMDIEQRRALAGVGAADLADHHFGVAVDLQAGRVVGRGVLERDQQRGVLSVVVIAIADGLADLHAASGGMFDDDAHACGAWATARSSVHVCDHVRFVPAVIGLEN